MLEIAQGIVTIRLPLWLLVLVLFVNMGVLSLLVGMLSVLIRGLGSRFK